MDLYIFHVCKPNCLDIQHLKYILVGNLEDFPRNPVDMNRMGFDRDFDK